MCKPAYQVAVARQRQQRKQQRQRAAWRGGCQLNMMAVTARCNGAISATRETQNLQYIKFSQKIEGPEEIFSRER
jgi:hypothetical protein